jgi:hypothetical protein
MTEIEESMNFDFEFTTPLFFEIEESAIGVAMITGTLLSEGVSRNGNQYTLDMMDQIAQTAIGAPIFFGTTTRVNPNTGLLTKNMHLKEAFARVGEITETWIDNATRKIKFRAHIIANETFPNLVNEIKKGWGVSIGGKGFGKTFFDAAGRKITKILSMIVNHVQLLSPDMPSGVDDAKIETAEPKIIQESMMWVEEEPTINHIHISL